MKGIEPSQPAWKAGALPLSYTRRDCLENLTLGFESKWGRQDSNLRRLRHQIYSLAHLAALEHPRRMPENPHFHAKNRHTDLAAGEERGKIAIDFPDVKQTERIFRYGLLIGNPLPEIHLPRSRKASGGTRTHNLRFTKPLLCQLSYTGEMALDCHQICAAGEQQRPAARDARRTISGSVRRATPDFRGATPAGRREMHHVRRTCQPRP